MVRLESSADDGADVGSNYAKGAAKIAPRTRRATRTSSTTPHQHDRHRRRRRRWQAERGVAGGPARGGQDLQRQGYQLHQGQPRALHGLLPQGPRRRQVQRPRAGPDEPAHQLHKRRPRSTTRGLVVVEQKGWYVGRVTLTYEEQARRTASGIVQREAAGRPHPRPHVQSHALPPRSRSVKLVVENNTWPGGRGSPGGGTESKTFDWAPAIQDLDDPGYADLKEGEANGDRPVRIVASVFQGPRRGRGNRFLANST